MSPERKRGASHASETKTAVLSEGKRGRGGDPTPAWGLVETSRLLRPIRTVRLVRIALALN